MWELCLQFRFKELSVNRNNFQNFKENISTKNSKVLFFLINVIITLNFFYPYIKFTEVVSFIFYQCPGVLFDNASVTFRDTFLQKFKYTTSTFSLSFNFHP